MGINLNPFHWIAEIVVRPFFYSATGGISEGASESLIKGVVKATKEELANMNLNSSDLGESAAEVVNNFIKTMATKVDLSGVEEVGKKTADAVNGVGNNFFDNIKVGDFAEKLAENGNEANNRFFDKLDTGRFGDNVGTKIDDVLKRFLDSVDTESLADDVGTKFYDTQNNLRTAARLEDIGEEWGNTGAEAFDRATTPLIDAGKKQLNHLLMGAIEASAVPALIGVGFALLGTTVAIGAPLAMFYVYHKMKHNIGKPSLATKIRNVGITNSIYNGITLPLTLASQAVYGKKQKEQPVFNVEISKQIHDILNSIISLRKHNGYFENLLLYGPGGTGKTMVAQKLAEDSNISYIQMSGGDLAQYITRGEHVTELNKLMKWAKKKPTILFIDEAEGFFRDRAKMDRSQLIELLNAFLNHTGTQSKNLMIIAATNRMEDLDEAVLSRFTHKIHIGPPALTERKEIIKQYAGQFFKGEELNKFFNMRKISHLAEKTEGLTGRALFQLVNSISNKKLANNNQLTQEIIDRTTQTLIDQEKEIVERRLRAASSKS